MRTRTIAAATLFALAGTAHAQLAEWNNSAGGLWTDPANWDPMVAPNAGSFTASIALPGTYDVFINVSRIVGTLSLTNPNASVTIELADSLSVDTGIINDGLIVVNNNAGGAGTNLFMRAAVTPLSGTGTLRLNGLSTRANLSTTTNATILHGPDHTIDGFGRIDAEMTNNGLIDANVTGQAINITTEPMTNAGTLRGSNGGTLDLNGMTITQSGSGEIIADGGTVLLGSVDVIGGRLDSINGGTMLVDVSSGFDAVTIDGDLGIELSDRIDVTNGLTNNATLTVNTTTGSAATILQFQDAGTLGGTGTLVLNGLSVRSQFVANNGTVTHAAPHTIRGFGRISGPIDNRSPITADVPGQVLLITNSALSNTSVISATADGILNFENSPIDNTGGVIRADAGQVLFGNVTVTGGTVETINGGNSLVDSTSTFNNVTLDGDLDIEIADTLIVNDGLVNNGMLTVNTSSGGATTAIRYEDSSSLSGTGTVILNGLSSRSQITTDADQTLTHEAPHVIRGFGRIAASIVHNSTITADVENQAISVDGSTIDNNGVLRAELGGTLDINTSSIENQTGVIIADGGTVTIGTTTVNGGTVEAPNSGLIFVNGPSAFDAVTNRDALTIEIGDTLSITNDLTNNGVLTVNNNGGGASTNLRFNDDSTLTGSGTVVLNGLSVRAQLVGLDGDITATQASSHSIEGQGQISVALINEGTIALGFPGVTPIREMLATEDITNTDSANYIIEVQGDNNSDLIDSSAAYHADGTLTVELINGFDPADYWNTSIIQADGGVTGRYKTIVAPVPSDSRLIVRARYLPNEIRVGAVCKPDIDFNGLVNFFDITAFIALFNAEDPDADIAAPFGAWNFFDIAAYIGQFNAGCP